MNNIEPIKNIKNMQIDEIIEKNNLLMKKLQK